jgi:hypothetical protein
MTAMHSSFENFNVCILSSGSQSLRSSTMAVGECGLGAPLRNLLLALSCHRMYGFAQVCIRQSYFKSTPTMVSSVAIVGAAIIGTRIVTVIHRRWR